MLGPRNSYSKTDPDATFMRMKDDHMRNGQLKPAYNIQTGTENQFIVGYSIHQKTTDTSHLIPHLNHFKKVHGHLPSSVTADAGYGSEENYSYLEKQNIKAFVKYNLFHKEQSRKFKKDIFRVENLRYDRKSDIYLCPLGRRMRFLHTQSYRTANGYLTSRRYYRCEDCSGCALREQCHRSARERTIAVGFNLNRLKKKARKLLNSRKGHRLRALRGVEVESVFGQLKHNGRFRRFMLRGLEKVHLEWGLLSIAHNMKKVKRLLR